MTQPTVSESTEGSSGPKDQASIPPGPPHHVTSLHIQYIHKNESKHSEMGPVRQNPIQRPVSLFIRVCIALCTIVAHNIAQNRPDNFSSYPPDNHHCSDDVYLREGEFLKYENILLNILNMRLPA